MNTCEIWAGVMRDGEAVACGRPARRRIDTHDGPAAVCAEHYAAVLWGRARPLELYDQDADDAR